MRSKSGAVQVCQYANVVALNWRHRLLYELLPRHVSGMVWNGMVRYGLAAISIGIAECLSREAGLGWGWTGQAIFGDPHMLRGHFQ